MKPKTTTADIADLVEFALNEAKPDIKTKRDLDGIELKIGRAKFRVNVTKMKPKRAA